MVNSRSVGGGSSGKVPKTCPRPLNFMYAPLCHTEKFCQAQPQLQLSWAELALVSSNTPTPTPTPGQVVKYLIYQQMNDPVN